MRKFAMTTIAAATLLVGGLTGCGVDNQAGDMGGGAFRGAGAGTGHGPTAEHRGMTGARYTGEGPITDMFTRDDRTGRGMTGQGVDQRRGAPIQGGQLGVQDRHGFGLDNRGMDRTGQQDTGLFGQDRAGQRGTGLFGQDRAGQRGTGLFGQDRAGQRGTGLFGQDRAGQRGTGLFGQDRAGQQGTGLFGQDRGQRGTGLFGQGGNMGGEFGARGGAGFTNRMGETGMTGGYHGMGGDPGFTGQRMGGTMAGQRGITGATGITGGQRPGMVDDQGILRGQRAGHKGMGAQNNTRGITGQQQTGQNNQVQEIKRIVDQSENVRNSHVVVHGNSVMIGIETDGQNAQALQNKIKQQVESKVQGLDVYVITDREQVNQLRTMNERVQNGGAMEEIGATFTEMTRDLGRAAKRPFERTR